MDFENRSNSETEVARLRSQNRELTRENRELREKNTKLETRLEEFEELMSLDPQTGLPIRRRFVRALSAVLESEASSASGFTVIGVIRLDSQYRRIRVSRDRSNALLFKSTLRIRAVIGDDLYQSDRFDEFLFFRTGIRSEADALELGRQVNARVAMAHDPPAEDILFGCTVGLSLYPRDGKSLDQLLEAAFIAVGHAENSGETAVTYSSSMGRLVRERRQIERAMGRSIQNGFRGFFIEYQPIVDRSSRVVGAEALLRLRTKKHGTISPGRFVPIAEENGDIRVVGQWMIFQACLQLATWRSAGHKDFRLAVNLSPLQFKQRDLASRIKGVLAATGLASEALKIELTESMIMADPELAIRTMRALRDLGISLSIDDFGTGYSSLAYLRSFPVDVLKIDKSFVDGICDDESDRQIVKAIISMSRSLGLESLAEGAERQCQVDILREFGCDLLQGFYFSKPIGPEALERMLVSNDLRPDDAGTTGKREGPAGTTSKPESPAGTTSKPEGPAGIDELVRDGDERKR